MKCPKCKKSSELQTKRTKANGREVVRERYCPKCKNRFITIERFDTDIAAAESRYERRIHELEQNNEALKEEIMDHNDLFRGFRDAMANASRNR